jgi:Methyltransferase domain
MAPDRDSHLVLLAMIDNPVRGRFNAWLLGALDDYMHAKYGEAKSRLFTGAPPVVLEIGPGSGANMRYYTPGTRVIAIEPNVRMHERLRRRAENFGLALDIHSVGAEHLDVETGSLDLACATLVLCSVANPTAVVAKFVVFCVLAGVSCSSNTLWHRRAQPWRGCNAPLENRGDGCLRDATCAIIPQRSSSKLAFGMAKSNL